MPGPISSSRDAVVGRRDNDSCPHGDYKGRRRYWQLNKAANSKWLISEGVECNEASKRGVGTESNE